MLDGFINAWRHALIDSCILMDVFNDRLYVDSCTDGFMPLKSELDLSIDE